MCKIYKILYAAVPFKRWRDVLIRRHFERCPDCAGEYEIPGEIRASLEPAWIEKTPSLWIQVRRLIEMGEKSPVRRPESRSLLFRAPRWALAAIGASAILVGALSYFLFVGRPDKKAGLEASRREAPTEASPRVLVISVELKGKPAKSFIYQTPKASFIWITPSKEIGG